MDLTYIICVVYLYAGTPEEQVRHSYTAKTFALSSCVSPAFSAQAYFEVPQGNLGIVV